MRKIYLLSTLVLFMLVGNNAKAQDFSNQGKEFWLAYSYHVGMIAPGGAPSMTLYLSSDVATTYTVEIYGAATIQTGNIVANGVVSVVIPNTYFVNADGLFNGKAIHVTSVKPIVVYSFITRSQASAATLCLPTNVLGKEYYSASFTQVSNEPSSNSFITIVGVEDNTSVEITPTGATNGGWAANTLHTITLNKGQVYQVLGTVTGTNGVDLCGTKVKSVASAGGGCKRIAVFSGSGKLSVSTPSCTGGSADNLYQQLYPAASWGKKYLTVPSYGKPNNYFRILRSDPLSNVYLNGTLIPAASFVNNYYQFFNNTPNLIESDIPVSVVQYFTSQGCPVGSAPGGNPSPYDPDMIVLNPVEQNINKVTLVSSPLTVAGTHQHNLHVVMHNGGTGKSSFTLDGTDIPVASWVIHPKDPNYSYLYLPDVGPGNHTIYSDSGFNATAYGYGNAETYGYSAGANVKDIYQYVSIANQYATVNFPATCKNSPFNFSMTFPYQPTEINWTFGATLNGFGIPDQTITNGGLPIPPSSTIIVGSKTLYVYLITALYSIPTAGTYPIKVTAINPTSDGCGGSQEINYDLHVYNNPVADFNFNNVCFPNPVQFTDNSTTDRPVTSRFWRFGDLNTSTAYNPLHPYAVAGTYTVKYTFITDIGCLADTIAHDVVISPPPTATIAGSTQVCQNATAPDITFTAADGIAPYTFLYSINGINQPTVVAPVNTVTVSVPTTTVGTFTYKLLTITGAAPSLCSQSITGQEAIVDVKALPTASISGDATVCQNSPSQTITFTGATGTAPYTFTYKLNSVTQPTISSVGPTATITVPTTVPGIFTYELVSVKDGSSLGCSQNQSGTVTVTVNELPTASISSSVVKVCVNGTPPTVTLTGAGGSVPYKFNYKINGISQPAVFSTGPSITLTVPVTTANTFIYQLVDVTDNSTTLCSQAQTGSVTVTVNPLPTPDFTLPPATCETTAFTFNDASVPNTGTMFAWTWDFGDFSSTSPNQNPSHTYTAAGTYTVTLSVTNSEGCVSDPVLVRNITVNRLPVAAFDLPEVCLSDTYSQFTDNSTATVPDVVNGWTWNFGDPGSGPLNTSNAQNGQHTYTAIGNYTVSLTATTNKGCKSTLSQPFIVNGDIPVSNFNALSPATLCANDSVAIQDASSVNFGSITKVEIYWDNVGAPGTFDTDDLPTTGEIYKHKYPNFQSPLTKTFTIRYRAYSGGTCVNDKLKNITVNAAPKVQFDNMPDACLDAAPFQITQASEIGGVPGTGVFSGPGVTAGGIFNPSSVGPGTYRIKYTFTSSAGGCVDTLSNLVRVLEASTAGFTFSSLACEKSAVTFNSDLSSIPAGNGTITGWHWDFGDPSSGPANTSIAQYPTHTFMGWGNYNVKLYVTTSNSCRSATATLPVLVNPIARPNFTVPTAACLPSASIVFNNTSTIPDGTEASFTYLWNFDDPPSGVNNTSSNSGPTHIYTAAGPYNVNLLVTSGAGCPHDTTIVVNNIHPQPTGSFTVDKADVCVGQSISFADNSNPADGTTQQWHWEMGDANVKVIPSFSYTFGTAGSYDVTLYITNNFGCRSTVFTQPVTINPYPTVDAGPDLYILQDGSDTLQPVVNAINPTYAWTPNLYFVSSNTIKNAIVKGVEDITYRLTVTGRGGCVRFDDVFIKVLKGPEIPNIFSPNGDGVHDKWIIKYLDTYPECTVEIFNRYGQRIFSSVGYGTPWDGTVNGKEVPIGTYYYIVNPKNGRTTMSGYVDVIR